jgi:N-acylneuraminate cytidylyltransferase
MFYPREKSAMLIDIVALLGVRAGSKRVSNKNGREFADSNLLTIKIETLKQVHGLSRIIVNSESPELLAVARKAGADTILRDPQFATDHVLTSDYYQHIAENCACDVILSATVTTPFVEPESYESGIETYLSLINSDYDSVTSCFPLKEFLYKDGKALNYDPAKQIRSQDLPDIVSLNYGFSIINRQKMIEYKNIVGKRPFFVKLSKIESIDIDTPEDFFIAETLYQALRIKKIATPRAA